METENINSNEKRELIDEEQESGKRVKRDPIVKTDNRFNMMDSYDKNHYLSKYIFIDPYGILFINKNITDKRKLNIELDGVCTQIQMLTSEILEREDDKFDKIESDEKYYEIKIPNDNNYTDIYFFPLNSDVREVYNKYIKFNSYYSFLYKGKNYRYTNVKEIKELKYYLYYCHILVGILNDFEFFIKDNKIDRNIIFINDDYVVDVIGVIRKVINNHTPKLIDFNNQYDINIDRVYAYNKKREYEENEGEIKYNENIEAEEENEFTKSAFSQYEFISSLDSDQDKYENLFCESYNLIIRDREINGDEHYVGLCITMRNMIRDILGDLNQYNEENDINSIINQLSPKEVNLIGKFSIVRYNLYRICEIINKNIVKDLDDIISVFFRRFLRCQTLRNIFFYILSRNEYNDMIKRYILMYGQDLINEEFNAHSLIFHLFLFITSYYDSFSEDKNIYIYLRAKYFYIINHESEIKYTPLNFHNSTIRMNSNEIDKNINYYMTLNDEDNVYNSKVIKMANSNTKVFFNQNQDFTKYYDMKRSTSELFERTKSIDSLFNSLGIRVLQSVYNTLKFKYKIKYIEKINEIFEESKFTKVLMKKLKTSKAGISEYFKYYLFILSFYLNNNNYFSIIYEMENYKLLNNFGDETDRNIAKIIEKIGTNDKLKTFGSLGNMNLFEVENEINIIKWNTFGYFGLYVVIYYNGTLGQRNYCTEWEGDKNVDNKGNDYIEKNDFRRLYIPIHRLDDHFLTKYLSFSINKKEVDKDAMFFEEYKRVKANNQLLYSFNKDSITRIQLSISDVPMNNKTKLTGGYIPYKIIKSNDIIEKYSLISQIYTEENLVDPKKFNKCNCFVNAIFYSNNEQLVFTNEELQKIKVTYGKGMTVRTNINKFCDDYNVKIIIQKIYVEFNQINDNKTGKEVVIKPKDDIEIKRTLKICYMNFNGYGHFFPFLKIKEISGYCLKFLDIFNPEYHLVCEKGRSIIENNKIIHYSGITRIDQSGTKEPWGNTFLLFKRLISLGCFQPLSAHEISITAHENKNNSYSVEDIKLFSSVYSKPIEIDENKIIIKRKNNNKNKKSKNLIQQKRKDELWNDLTVADTETYIDDNNNVIPYCICLIRFINGIYYKKEFYGKDCQANFLNHCVNEGINIVYFHNLKFDGFLFKDFRIIHMIYHSSRLYSLTFGLLRNKSLVNIELRDSLSLIPTKLSNFNKMFSLNNMEKEIFPYDLIKEDIINKDLIKIEQIKEYLSDDDFNKFLQQNKEIIINENISIKTLTIKYCKKDCEILLEGLLSFQDMIMKQFNIGAFNFLTISSLSYYVMKINCFVNLPSYNGDIKSYIRNAIRGGRCMVANNEKIMINNDMDIVDFDACSLYPSAMKRLGLPTGPIYYSDNKDEIYNLFYNSLMKEEQEEPDNNKYVSYMILKIKILSINKKRKFPLICKKSNGINIYTNDLDNEIIFLTSLELEDLIRYQNVKFEIIDCLFWTGRKDFRMSNYIEEIYNLRKHYKQNNNKLETVLKLFMNSSYGKTIQKDIAQEDKFKTKDESKTYINNNYQRIKEVIDINKYSQWFKLEGSYIDEYIPIHIGCLILAMSKRLMNEVIVTAENNNIDIFYQDTDSIHLYKKDISRLEKLYFINYERDLIGNNMGQFHVDFPLINNKESVSKKSIFLGKKCYIDFLENEDGDTKNFIRMKGVPSKAVESAAKELNISVFDLYKKMYEGEEIEFDLISNNLPSFEYQKNFGIKLRKEFKRILKF